MSRCNQLRRSRPATLRCFRFPRRSCRFPRGCQFGSSIEAGRLTAASISDAASCACAVRGDGGRCGSIGHLRVSRPSLEIRDARLTAGRANVITSLIDLLATIENRRRGPASSPGLTRLLLAGLLGRRRSTGNPLLAGGQLQLRHPQGQVAPAAQPVLAQPPWRIMLPNCAAIPWALRKIATPCRGIALHRAPDREAHQSVTGLGNIGKTLLKRTAKSTRGEDPSVPTGHEPR